MPRIPQQDPYLTGRNIAFAGATYTKQYHGVDLYDTMNATMFSDNSQYVYDTLAKYNVNYVLYGAKEQFGSWGGRPWHIRNILKCLQRWKFQGVLGHRHTGKG